MNKKMVDIYNQHKFDLFKYAKNIKNSRKTEDAVHNAFMAIIKQKEKYLNMNVTAQDKCPGIAQVA